MYAVEHVLYGVYFCFADGQYGEVCMFGSTLYDLRNGDVSVLSWARVRRMCLGSDSSVVFIGGGGGVYCCEVGVYVLFCNCVWVTADVCCVYYIVLLDVGFFLSLGVCLYSGCDGCCAFSLICDACSLRCSWSGSISVSSF